MFGERKKNGSNLRNIVARVVSSQSLITFTCLVQFVVQKVQQLQIAIVPPSVTYSYFK